MISTVNAIIGEQVIDTGFHVTTPEATDIQHYLSMMVAQSLTHVVLEATSHGLAQHRVAACHFDVGVVTNITHEHLDYHKSYPEYRSAKASLFDILASRAVKDPPEYPQKADATDIFILKELEIDATTSFKAIAQKLNTSVPLVKYHYDRHVVDLCLLEDFQVVFYPFDKSSSNGFFFTFKFDTLEKMAKFARSLMNKPFALSLGKIFGEPALFAYIYLPMSEFRKFVDSLGQLIRNRFLRRYEYLLQDGAMTQRYTIPYKRFRDQSWVYDQGKYMEKARVLLEADSARQADGLRETQALLPWQPQETSHVSTEVINLERS